MEEFYEGELKELVYNFFLKFSRFEFSLKESGYVRANVRSGIAEADWNKFLDEFGNGYIADDDEKELLADPPKKQVYENQRLRWEEFTFDSGSSDLKNLTLAIRTMRNNLFHGGKYGPKDWDNSERVNFVLSRGLHCLDKMAQLSAELNVHYTGSY